LSCISITIICIVFLIRNAKRIRWVCRSIVRVQTSLGLLQPGALVAPSVIADVDDCGLKSASVLPISGQDWGRGDWMLSLWPHLLGLVICCIACCATLYVAILY
jgi:hypothetical protein